MTAVAVSQDAPTFPAAELDRRFYAFMIDRLIAWPLEGLAVFAAYHYLLREGAVVAGVAVIVAGVLLVGFVFSALQGLQGFTPGKVLLGLRVVHLGTGTPIGIVAAMIRSLILGFSALPTFGLGLATLAWTAVMDRGRQRRGWHDHMTESIVVDVRPTPVEAVEVDHGPRHVVNLTAMRLVPTTQQVPATPPSRGARRATAPGVHAGAPAAAEAAAGPVSPGTPGPAGLPPTYAPPDLPPAEPPAAGAGPAPAPATSSAPAPASSPSLRAPLGPPADLSTAEQTTVRSAGGATDARWRVHFDTGESFVVEGMALVGRRPEPRPGEPVSHLVPLPSQDMSLSKTHAQFQVAPDGVLVVMDRGSTNGSVLVRQGVPRDLSAGKPTTLLSDDVVRFGDRTMTVTREA